MVEKIEGYCMKEKKKVVILNPIVTKTSRGVRMAKGTCPTCGTKVSAMLKKEVAK